MRRRQRQMCIRDREYRVQGCTSNLWMVPKFIDGKINLSGSSDSVIVKGLFYLVYFAYNEETPETIINNPLSFFEEIGLSNHLGQSRSNGLNSLRKKIKSIATVQKPQLKEYLLQGM